jgi:hypothetical protein
MHLGRAVTRRGLLPGDASCSKMKLTGRETSSGRAQIEYRRVYILGSVKGDRQFEAGKSVRTPLLGLNIISRLEHLTLKSPVEL